MDDGNKEEETIGIGFKIVTETHNKVNEDDLEIDNTNSLNTYNLFDYIIAVILNLVRSINNRSYNNSLYKEVLLDANFHLFHKIYHVINNEDLRVELIEYGITNTNE